MKKLLFISDNELYEDLLGEKFPNRLGNYIEHLLKKCNIPLEDCEFLKTEESWQNHPSLVRVTLGRNSTGQVLNLKKSAKLSDYVGISNLAWYDVNYLLNRGKKVELETINFLKEVYELVKTKVLEKQN
jgi:hypothetical protein